MIVIQTYASKDCNEFDVLVDDVRVAYYIEHFVHPAFTLERQSNTEEVLQSPVFEIYYDYNEEDDEYTSSLISKEFDDIQEVIDSF